MDELTRTQPTEVGEQYSEALKLHQQIMVNGEIAASALVEMCKSLKLMRDGKYYSALGFDNFEDYCEQMAGIKSRQAYTYISTYERLGEKVLQSNANLGITKLEMISQLPFYEQQEVIDSNDLEGMSTREVKELIAKAKEQGEQISLLTEENEKLKAEQEETQFPAETIAEINELKKQVASLRSVNEDLEKDMDKQCDERRRLESELDELKKKPVEVAISEPSPEEIAKIKEQAKAEAEKDYSEKLKSARKSADEARKQAEEYRTAAEQADELKKKLESAKNDKVKEFRIYFEDTQSRLAKLFGILAEIEDEEIHAKLTAATVSFLDTIKKDLKS